MSADSVPGPGLPPAAGAAEAGVIHDIGYQAYTGPRYGSAQIVRALAWHSFRSAFGFGRGAKAKIIPVITFGIMCLPAVVSAVVIALSPLHDRPISYDVYLGPLRTLVMLVFLAAQAPDVVSRDLRSHILPLYFARPIHRIDYPAAKLAAFTGACLVMLEVPLLLLYVGTISQVRSTSDIWAETRALIPGLLMGLAWAALLASLGLLLASFSGRRAYATGAVAIFFFLTDTLANILVHVGGEVFGPRGAAVSGAAAPALSRLAGLISPFTVLDGMRQWLGGTTHTALPPPGSYGPLYGAAFLLFLAVGTGGLALRYRRVGLS
jgi:ABC-2 type transport system permease protein